MRFRDLARHMAPDQPFYGLQAQGLDGSDLPASSAWKIWPTSTWNICIPPNRKGLLPRWLFIWGYVAMEMARRLLAQGEEVRALIFL